MSSFIAVSENLNNLYKEVENTRDGVRQLIGREFIPKFKKWDKYTNLIGSKLDRTKRVEVVKGVGFMKIKQQKTILDPYHGYPQLQFPKDPTMDARQQEKCMDYWCNGSLTEFPHSGFSLLLRFARETTDFRNYKRLLFLRDVDIYLEGAKSEVSQALKKKKVKDVVKLWRAHKVDSPIDGIEGDCGENSRKVADGQEVGAFLWRHRTHLDPYSLGEFLGGQGTASGDEEIEATRTKYIGSMSFKFLTIERGVRSLFTSGGFALPRESQKLSRIVKTFSKCYFEDNMSLRSELCPFEDSFSVEGVVSIIFWLNTSLHDKEVPKHDRLTKKAFLNLSENLIIRLMSGQHRKRQFTELLENIYDSIKGDAIIFNPPSHDDVETIPSGDYLKEFGKTLSNFKNFLQSIPKFDTLNNLSNIVQAERAAKIRVDEKLLPAAPKKEETMLERSHDDVDSIPQATPLSIRLRSKNKCYQATASKDIYWC